MKRIIIISKKEVFHIIRDKRTLIISFLMPVFMLILYGYAITLDVKNIDFSIYDEEKSLLSREFLREFEISNYFTCKKVLSSMKEVEPILNKGKVKMVILVGKDFTYKLKGESDIDAEILINGIDSNTAQITLGYIKGILNHFLTKKGIYKENIGIREKVLYNPELKSNLFIAPGVIPIILMMLATILTSTTIIREKQDGTLYQIFLSRLYSGEFIIGKILPYSILGLIDIVVVTLVAHIIFDVPIKGNIFLLFIFSFLFLFSAFGIGLFISTVAGTQEIAILLSMLWGVLPSIILSGFVFPIKNMPGWLQIFTNIVPARHFLVIIRGILLKGVTTPYLIHSLLALTILSTIFLYISSIRISKIIPK
jgi:ABC-2 type transport system permease protein